MTDNPDSPHLLAPKIKAGMYFGIASNDDMQQPDAKDKLKEAFAAAKVPPKSKSIREPCTAGACRTCPAGQRHAHLQQADAERAWGKLLALYKAGSHRHFPCNRRRAPGDILRMGNVTLKRAWLLVACGAMSSPLWPRSRCRGVSTEAWSAYDDIPLPADYKVPSEWVFARLMYPQNPVGRGGGFGFRRGHLDWRQGGTSWTQDYPRADRHFAHGAAAADPERTCGPSSSPSTWTMATKSTTGPGWLAGEMGEWLLTRDQAAKLRDFLLRGGFLVSRRLLGGPEEWGTALKLSMKARISRTAPSSRSRTTPTRSSIRFSIWTTGIRSLGQWACKNGRGRMHSQRVAGTVAQWKRHLRRQAPAGGRDGASTRMWGIPGNSRTIRATRTSTPSWGFASASITSPTR